MFSIITINFNNDVGLRRTINSVLCQNFVEFEYIIVDGCSTDDSVSILKSVDDTRVSYISEPDRGIYDALNKGVSLASRKFILFLNSGDVLYSSKVLQKFSNVILSNRSFSGYYGLKLFADYSPDCKDGQIARIWFPGPSRLWRYLYGWMIPHQALLVDREMFVKYGGFDRRFKIAADYDWLLRVFFVNREPVLFCKFRVLVMENGGISNSSLANVLRANFEVILSWKKYYCFFPFWIFFTKPLLKICQIVRVKNAFKRLKKFN